MADYNWVPGAITGTLALISIFVAGWLQSRRERNQHRLGSASPGAPTVQEIWKRQDHQERVLRAAIGVIGEVAEQWDAKHPPVLSKRHVAVLSEEGYMPPGWEPMTASGA